MTDQAPSVGYRRELLQATSEEELLSQQTEFLSKNRLPSAKVTRVKRKTGSASQGARAVAEEGRAAEQEEEKSQPNLEGPDISTIITDVVEKTSSPAAPPALSLSGPQAAFPEATHRKMSKFALGRKSKKPTSSSATAAPAPQPPQPVKDIITPIEDAMSLRESTVHPSGESSQLTSTQASALPLPLSATSMAGSINASASSPLPIKSSLSSGSQGSKGQRRVTFGDDVVGGLEPVPPVPPAPTSEGEGCTSERELSSIDKQNRDQIASMSEEERREAMEDLQSRLSPSVLEFLKKRGAKKLQGEGLPAVAGHKVGGNRPSTTGTHEGHHTLSFTNPPPALSSSGPPRHQSAPPSSGVLGRKDGLADLLDSDDAPADQEEDDDGNGNMLDDRLVARVRFGLEGEPVGVQQSAELSLEEQVLQRDALRQDEGVVPSEGYTATELTVLARSTVSSQRVAALKLISALLAQSKPSVDDLDVNGSLKARPMRAPEGYTERFVLDWGEVWRHMLTDLRIATSIRVALDDSVSTVVAAAAEALYVLGGAGAAEDVLTELMESMPIAGWPKLRLAALKRPHAAGLWESALDVSLQVEREGQKGPAEPWSEEDQTPEELAGSDPLAGLLQMALLPRIRHILLNRTAPTAFPYLLATLSHLAACSSAAADFVASYPGILESLSNIAESYPTPADESSHQQSKLAALRLVRILIQSSSAAAESAQSAGLLQYPQRILMMASTEDGLDQLLMQLEAMRTWRAAAIQGLPVMNMDDIYPYLAHCLLPPPRDSAIDLQEGGGAFCGTADALQQLRMEAVKWLMAAEGHLLLSSLLTHSACVHQGDTSLGPVMISSGAAAALIHEAREALSASGLRRLQKLLGVSSLHLFNTQTRHRGFVRLPHPALAIPPASCASAYTAAVMNCLATYWQVYAPVLRPDQVHPPSPSSLQTVGLSHSWITPGIPQWQAALSATEASCTGSHLLGLLLGLASGAALRDAPLSQIPRAAKLLCQAAGAALLQSTLLLVEANYPDARERWSAARGVLVPIMQHVKLDASERKYAVKTAQPWALALMQSKVPTLALLSTSVRILRDCWRGADGLMVLQDRQECTEESLSVMCMDAMAAALASAPPGYEVPCLNMLAAAFSKPVMGPVLRSADTAMSKFASTPGALQRAAAGQTRHNTETQGAVMFPRPPAPSVGVVTRYLFHSYAASWLSFLNADKNTPPTPSTTASADALPPRPVPQLQPAYIHSTSASRLPAPAYWMMKEAHALPQHLPAITRGQQPAEALGAESAGQDASAESNLTADDEGVNVVGAAVLVCLGLEAAGSKAMGQLPRSLKLQCLLQLCYIFDVLELVPPDLKPSVYTSWTDPSVRWPLAALTHLLVHGSFTPTSGTPEPQATNAVVADSLNSSSKQGLTDVEEITSTADQSTVTGTATAYSASTASSDRCTAAQTSCSSSSNTDCSKNDGGTHSIPSTHSRNTTYSCGADGGTKDSSTAVSTTACSTSSGNSTLNGSTLGSSTGCVNTPQSSLPTLSDPRLLSPSESQLPLVLPSAWASSSLAEQITDIFVSSSMLDPLFGAHMALLLMPVPVTESQTAQRRARMTAPAQHAWNLMASEGVLHLLPKLEDCPGAPTAYEAVYTDESMLDLLVKSASSGELDKACEVGALPAWLTTRSLAVSLLSWAPEESVLRLRAESRLRSILRGAGPEFLKQLLEELQARVADKAPQFLQDFILKAVASDPALQQKVEALMPASLQG